MIAPGGTIGILGGGQLGRMLAIAAAPLGYRCHIFSPEPGGPAAQVSAAETVAAYDDRTALDAFGAAVDVVTVEFENVPASALEQLSDRVPVRPGARSLQVAQNRVSEKDFVRGLGLETTPYAPIEEDADADAADLLVGRPAVLKTQTLGYDGKGQVVLAAGDDLRDAWYGPLDGRPAILEALVAIEREVSVVVARAPDGRVASFDPVENRHVNGILDLTLAPADVSPALAAAARDGRRAHRPGTRPRRGSLRRAVRHRRRPGFWSTRSPPASTTPATGPSRVARPANSHSTSAPSAACRWAPLQGAPMPP